MSTALTGEYELNLSSEGKVVLEQIRQRQCSLACSLAVAWLWLARAHLAIHFDHHTSLCRTLKDWARASTVLAALFFIAWKARNSCNACHHSSPPVTTSERVPIAISALSIIGISPAALSHRHRRPTC